MSLFFGKMTCISRYNKQSIVHTKEDMTWHKGRIKQGSHM